MRVEQQIEYEAQSDAEAIQVARSRLGREAVILSSRPIKLGGVLGMFKRNALWVTAGILVPEKEDQMSESRERMVAFQHLLEVRRAVTGAQDSMAERRAEPLQTSAFMPTASPVPPPSVQGAAVQAYEMNAVPRRAHEESHLSKDVDEIKEILTKVLARLDGDDDELAPGMGFGLDDNARKLMAADVEKNIAMDLVEEFRHSSGGRQFNHWLASKIPVMGGDPGSALGGRKILFAGPTGVGKTTSIAKIAAGQSLWANRKVVLMTADTYRIAAVEQLRTYAKILSIPIEITAEPRDVECAIRKHKDADLILLDTAGRSHYDDGRMEELHTLYEAFAPDTVHLVMASNVKYRDMLRIIDRMGIVPISALLFTKLDETASCGTILNVLRDFSLPASFFTNGQNVPNDIEVARGDYFVNLLFDNVMAGKEK
ncbi:MAG: flagellar biosynthesis protein FlhF [Synergistaceae bacterium]|nr:flagellar biosynthesis protein FlhF [Synergistaceae bacterium]